MEFRYTVSTPAGAINRGTITARTPADAVALLKQQGRIVVELQGVKKRRAVRAFRFRLGGVKAIERVLLAKHLALMLRAGLTIDRGIGILTEQTTNRTLRLVLREVLAAVQRGEALADAIARFPRVFSPLFVTIVRWGEAGGTLPESLERLATQLQRDYELKAKVKGAMIYPVVVIGMTVVVGGIIGVFVLPRLLKIFESFEVKLPLSTRIFLGVAKFITTYGAVALPGALIGAVLLFFLLRSKPLRPVSHWLSLRFPVFGGIVRQMNLARLDRILGSLLKSGIPVVEALNITADALGNLYFQRALRSVRERAQKGLSMGALFMQQRSLFPPVQSQMVAVGEETGRLDEVLIYLADFYEGEVSEKTKGLVQALEPVLLVFVGVVVGGVALSVITPIYQLVGSFTQ